MLTRLETIYQEYAEAVQTVRKNARLFDGFLGMGRDPRNDACHQDFYNAVGAWAEEFLLTEPEQDSIMRAALYMLETPATHNGQECCWFMFAAQGHMKSLIPLLSKEACAVLADRLEKLYKKRDRMPLQKELLKLLTQAAK